MLLTEHVCVLFHDIVLKNVSFSLLSLTSALHSLSIFVLSLSLTGNRRAAEKDVH